MEVPGELVLAYSLMLLGGALIVAPVLARIIGGFAPDPSLKLGGSLEHESVEMRRQRRLPLRRKFAALPDRGLAGGAVVLILLVPMFMMVTRHSPAWGVYLRLAPRYHPEADQNCLEGPIIVTVKQHGVARQLILSGVKVSQEDLERALSLKLAGRAEREVFVEGDDSMLLADLTSAIDRINSLQANAVILTPKLKQQMAKNCSRH